MNIQFPDFPKKQKNMTHKDLVVWQKSIDLVVDIYKLCEEFPATEKYGLSSQIQRAAVSIPSNIAEGAGRNSTKEYIRFLNIAQGSLSELETQLIISEKIGFKIKHLTIFVDIENISKMLYRLKESLNKKL